MSAAYPNPTGVCAACRRPLPAYTYFVDVVPLWLPVEVRIRYGVCAECAALGSRDEAGRAAVLTAVETFFLGIEANQ